MNPIDFVLNRRKWTLYRLHQELDALGIDVRYNTLKYYRHARSIRLDVLSGLLELSGATPRRFFSVIDSYRR